MRLRSKLAIIALAALAGFLSSRPDIREKISTFIDEKKSLVDKIAEKAKEGARSKEKELVEEVKATQE